MNAPLREYDVVRVINLKSPTRKFDGTDGVKGPPRLGDQATICELCDSKDPTAPVIAEMVDPEGMTVWLADFSPDELELVHRP